MINPDIKFNPIFSAQHKIITLDADHKHMRNVVKLELVRQTPPMYGVQREVSDMYVLLFKLMGIKTHELKYLYFHWAILF